MNLIIYISLYFVGIIITDVINKIFFKDNLIEYFEWDINKNYNDEDNNHIKRLKHYSVTLSIFWPIYLFVLSVIMIAKMMFSILAFICELITKISDLTVEKIKEKVSKDE